jgi:hypothetical protein|tara:strand:+ start:7633 stop:8034 length:402 start_codon:yes stop_codon:yes gene_type:complete
MRIGITGSPEYNDRRKIKDFIFNLKNKTSDDIEIVSRANKNGADTLVKKYALEFGYTYIEFPAAHGFRTLHTQLPESYFNKPFSISNYFVQTKMFTKYCDYLVVFTEARSIDRGIDNLLSAMDKLDKKAIIIA